MGFFLTYRIRTGSSMALEKDRIIKDTVTKGILVFGEAVATTVSAIAIPANVFIVPRKSGSRDINMYVHTEAIYRERGTPTTQAVPSVPLEECRQPFI